MLLSIHCEKEARGGVMCAYCANTLFSVTIAHQGVWHHHQTSLNTFSIPT